MGEPRANSDAKVRRSIDETVKALTASNLSSTCYHKIRRLHDDKIGNKGIASEIGCTLKEVCAALWKPTASSAFALFKASQECSAKVEAAGLPFNERSKYTGLLWSEAKSNGVSAQFEALAIEEKHAVMGQVQRWDTLMSEWLENRNAEPAPAASRDRPKPEPIVKKPKKAPGPPRPATAVQVRNKELKQGTEDAAARRARWFARNWEHVKPFLPPASQDPNSDFGKKILRQTAAHVAAGSATKELVIEPLPVQDQPRSIVGGDGFTMYPYQLEGMTWMLNQHRQGVGGILGDEMGLGKTLQVIAFLAALKDGGEMGPHMIIAPLSVLPTWEREFQRWCPSIKVVQFHGNVEARNDLWRDYLSTASNNQFGVIITTYEMLTAATSMLTHRTYSYVILDEAQRIKNETSLIGQAVRKLRSVNKLLITGTPLQNDMHELWALLNFMFPDVFASSEKFDMAFNRSFNTTNVDLDLVCAAHKLLAPLMIRRLKKDVQKNLPKKTVLTIWCPITDYQRFWYKKCLETSGCANELMVKSDDAATAAAPASSGGGKNKLMNLLMQLRKVVNHPYMFPEADLNPQETDDTIVTYSSKMMVLDRILNKLKAQGRRVLVYSQFTTMLDVIQDYCNLVGHGFMRLDGNTCLARRKYEIKMFNSKRGDQFVYLLSTRAGALGITLTGADTVIMFDSDWNPTWDKQAHDRVHRIGQDKEVTIYQLLCKDTVEQRIFQRAAQKLGLNELVLRDDTESKSDKKEDVLSSGEVKKMLRCGVMKILDGESILMTEASVDTLIAQAHARGEQGGAGPEEDAAEVKEEEETDVFNQKLLEVRQFGGKKFDSAREAMRSIADDWAAEIAASGARRERVSTVENVGGFQVKKINRSAKGPTPDQLNPKKKNPVMHDSACLYCGESGAVAHSQLNCCKAGHCHRSFHEPCLDAYLQRENKHRSGKAQDKGLSLAGTSCSQHQCSICLAKAAGRGGVIFRCWKCPLAFCGDCLPDEFEPLDVRAGEVIDQVKYLASSVEYLVCAGCTKGTTRKISRAMASLAATVGKKRPASESKTASQAPRKLAKNKASPKTARANIPHLNQRIRRPILDEAGHVLGFKDGTVVGFVPVEEAEYISEHTGRPAALWHVRYDNLDIEEEELEQVEVEDAVKAFQDKHYQQVAKSSGKSSSRQSSFKEYSPAKVRASPGDARQSRRTPPTSENGKSQKMQHADVAMVDSDSEFQAESSVAAITKSSTVLAEHMAPVAEVEEGASSSRETPIRPWVPTNGSPQKMQETAAVKLAVNAIAHSSQLDVGDAGVESFEAEADSLP